jgi:hypothetical protein
MAAADPGEMDRSVKASPLFTKYAEAVDRESAKEKLAAKLEAGAAKARAEQETTAEDTPRHGADKASAPAPRTRAPREEKSVVEEVLTSTTARQLGRTAVREIFRGLFKTGRR